MKRILFIFLLIISSVLLLSCKSNNTGEFYCFNDSLGNSIKLDHKPTKVAVLFSSFTEIWEIAGGTTSITVQESIDRNIVNNDVLIVDNGAGKNINIELLISYEPDFVICSSDIESQIDVYNTLKNTNIPCGLFRVDNFNDYLNVLNILTDITEQKENYKKYGLDIKEQINQLLNSVNDKNNKKILFIRAASSAKSTKAKAPSQHFVAMMLKELGTINIAEKSPILLDGLSIEEILKQNPDYIFISVMGDFDKGKNYIESLFNSSIYQSLDAVKNKKYYFLEKDLFQYKPNHNWYNAYLKLWEILNYE